EQAADVRVGAPDRAVPRDEEDPDRRRVDRRGELVRAGARDLARPRGPAQGPGEEEAEEADRPLDPRGLEPPRPDVDLERRRPDLERGATDREQVARVRGPEVALAGGPDEREHVG